MSFATVKLKSRILFMNTDISVFLPDPPLGREREFDKKYKVLWLLHGASGDHTEWRYGSHLAQYLRGRDTMAVMPSALNSDYGCYPDFGGGYDFPAYFFEELMPFVFGELPASSRPEDQILAGASMGGFGALSLGLQHPERFGGIGAFGCSLRESAFLEPFTEMTGAEFRAYAMAHRKELPTEYGDPAEGIKPKEINVIAKYPTVRDFLNSPECMYRRFPEAAASGKLPPMYIACGTEDLFYGPTLRMKALAEDCGAENITFDLVEGVGHSGRLWDLELKKLIDHFGL